MRRMAEQGARRDRLSTHGLTQQTEKGPAAHLYMREAASEQKVRDDSIKQFLENSSTSNRPITRIPTGAFASHSQLQREAWREQIEQEAMMQHRMRSMGRSGLLGSAVGHLATPQPDQSIAMAMQQAQQAQQQQRLRSQSLMPGLFSSAALQGRHQLMHANTLDLPIQQPPTNGEFRLRLIKDMIARQSELVDTLRREAEFRVRSREVFLRSAETGREVFLRSAETGRFDGRAAKPRRAEPTQGHPKDSSTNRKSNKVQKSDRKPPGVNQLKKRSGSGANKKSETSQPVASGTDQPLQEGAIPLSLPADDEVLSDYQLLIRGSIELFQADPGDVLLNRQGRRNNVARGQVGLRCQHCAHRPPHWRGRGAVYFPGSLTCIYQTAQNMAVNHLLKSCECISTEDREKLQEARQQQEHQVRRSGVKKYWLDTCRMMGLYEREGCSGIWFQPSRRNDKIPGVARAPIANEEIAANKNDATKAAAALSPKTLNDTTVPVSPPKTE